MFDSRCFGSDGQCLPSPSPSGLVFRPSGSIGSGLDSICAEGWVINASPLQSSILVYPAIQL